jgi:hypothetical protein
MQIRLREAEKHRPNHGSATQYVHSLVRTPSHAYARERSDLHFLFTLMYAGTRQQIYEGIALIIDTLSPVREAEKHRHNHSSVTQYVHSLV